MKIMESMMAYKNKLRTAIDIIYFFGGIKYLNITASLFFVLLSNEEWYKTFLNSSYV